MMINGLFTGSIQPDSIVCGCVHIYKNIWPKSNETIDAVNDSCLLPTGAAYWERGRTLGLGVNQSHRTNKVLSVTNHAEINNIASLQAIHNQFYLMLLATTIPYANKHSLNESLWHEAYAMLKYDEGEEYKSHYDSSTQTGRIISAVCYLNDDFDGGELEFVNFGVKIKPEKGMLILFPSNFAYSHVAHSVYNGSKYALVTWIKDRNI